MSSQNFDFADPGKKPNLEHDRKRAKELKKEIASGSEAAARRVEKAHPAFSGKSAAEILKSSFSLRDAQLVIARESGFESWHCWKEYVESFIESDDPEFARALSFIKYKKDTELEKLVSENPHVINLKDKNGDSLISYTISYANDPGEENLELWTSVKCARVLVKAGLKPEKETVFRALTTADTPMLKMFVEENAIDDSLRVYAAIGDLTRVKQQFENGGSNNTYLKIADAFRFAVRHNQIDTAQFLLEKYSEIDNQSLSNMGWKSNKAFLDYALSNSNAIEVDDMLTVDQFAVRLKATEAYGEENLEAFKEILRVHPELLSEENERFQIQFLEYFGYGNNPDFARAMLDAGASVQKSKPETKALIYAIDYGAAEVIDMYRKIWTPNDDLPTSAGLGDLEKVKSFFDREGKLKSHKTLVYPSSEVSSNPDEILLHALGLALMNQKFEVADYLIAHGADINGRWGLHEPAGLLHEMAGNNILASVKYLVEKGCNVTIMDDRFGSMAYGWAEYMQQKEVLDYLKPITIKASLWASVDCGTLDDVKLHVEAGANIHKTYDFIHTQSYTLLFLAVFRESPEIVDYLISQGADAKHLDSNRNGALHRINSESEQAIEVAIILLKAGCDPNEKNNKGQSAIDHARENGLSKVVELLSKGA